MIFSLFDSKLLVKIKRVCNIHKTKKKIRRKIKLYPVKTTKKDLYRQIQIQKQINVFNTNRTKKKQIQGTRTRKFKKKNKKKIEKLFKKKKNYTLPSPKNIYRKLNFKIIYLFIYDE